MVTEVYPNVKPTEQQGLNMNQAYQAQEYVSKEIEQFFPAELNVPELNYNQRLFLTCLPKTGYNIAKTCRIVAIDRGKFKQWMRDSEIFRDKFNDVKDERLDMAESILFQNMQHHNKFVSNAATIFFLKTQGQGRGYMERSQVDHNDVTKRTKEEIDAIIRAGERMDGIVIDAKVISSGSKELPMPMRSNNGDENNDNNESNNDNDNSDDSENIEEIIDV